MPRDVDSGTNRDVDGLYIPPFLPLKFRDRGFLLGGPSW